MNRKFYSLWFRLGKLDAYLLWFSDDNDGVFTANGKALTFRNSKDLLNYATASKLSLSTEEPLLHDLDSVDVWIKSENEKLVDCKLLLSAWNLFDDVSKSVGVKFEINRRATKKLYDKLFWGNNIPAVTPTQSSYEPIWSNQELSDMRAVLADGLSLFKRSIVSCE